MTARTRATDTVIDAVLSASADKRVAMLTRLAFAAAERPRGVSARRLRRLLTDHMDEIVDGAVTVARRSGPPMTDLLAVAVAKRRDIEAARRVVQAMGEGHGDLAVVEIACRRLTVADVLRRGVGNHPAEVVDDTARLVSRLHEIGRSRAAIGVLRRVLSAFRRADLATPLGLICQLGGLLADIGDYRRAELTLRGALASAEKAGVPAVEMADEWINLATVRSQLLDRQGALAACRQAIDLLEPEGQGDPQYREDRQSLLAVALSNFALFLQEIEDLEAARDAVLRAVALNERLAARAPAVHTPRLVESLINASFIVALRGDATEARKYSGRAVAEAEHLPAATLAAHGGALVSGLITHAVDLERQGEAEHAMEMAGAAADLAGRLLQDFGRRFLGPAVDAEAAVCNIGLQGNYLREARAAGERAMTLAADLPDDAMGFKFLEILPNLSDVYANSGAQAAAIEAATQGYRLLREAEAGNGAFLLDLDTRIGIRDIYAKRLSEAGRTADAVTMVREAIAVTGQPLDDFPAGGVVTAAPAHALVHLANMLADLGERNGALDAAAAAVGFLEKLAARDPEWAEEELPVALYTHANILWQGGAPEPALLVLDRVIDLNRRRVARDPRGAIADLAAALEFSAVVANRMGDIDRARAEIGEAIASYEQLVEESGEGFVTDLANGLHNAAIIVMTVNDVDGAIAMQERAAALLAGLAEKDANGQKLVADSLVNLGLYHAMAGRVDEGLAAVDRVSEVIGDLATDWLPARQTLIGAQVARSRLLIVAERHGEALASAEAAVQDTTPDDGDDFWRGPALVNRAMALAALKRGDAAAAAQEALAFHRAGLDGGNAEELHGYCDAAAVVIDVAATNGAVEQAAVRALLAPLTAWFARLGPGSRAVAAAELVRALDEHCGGAASWPAFAASHERRPRP